MTKARLHGLGYDFVTFGYEVGRSLSSVVLRAQEIYAASQPTGIVGGLWLFQMPWTDAMPDVVPADRMAVAYKAHLSGFSIQSTKNKGLSALLRATFPKKGSTVADFDVTMRVFRTRRAVIKLVEGFDLLRERDYLVAAEAILTGGVLWRILMTAVRSDFVGRVEPWTTRLDVPWEAGAYQSA